MLHWAKARVSKLPTRCLQLALGDINDDVGQSKQNGTTTRVQSLAVGEARQGLERFVGSSFRKCGEKQKNNKWEWPALSLRLAAHIEKARAIVSLTLGAFL